MLGPIGVRPDRQRQGVGQALMLLGHPAYPRFGFERARALALEAPAPWPDEAWMAPRLPAWTPDLRGIVHFPEAFDPR